MAGLPKLRILNGKQRGMSFPLVGKRIILGREPGPGVKIQDTMISRRHCSLSLREGEIWIDDLGSTNGTFVNGERITEGRRLQHGDEIRLGSTRAVLGPAAVEDDTQGRPRAEMPRIRLEDIGVDAQDITLQGDSVLPENLAARHLMTLLRWSERLREIEDPDLLCRELCQVAIEATDAHRAVVLLQRLDETASLVPTASCTRDKSDPHLRPISQTLLRAAVGKRSTILSLSPHDGLALGEEARSELGTVICSPMIQQGHVWGAIHVDTLIDSPPLSEQESELISNLAHQSAAAMAALDMVARLRESERQGHELTVARDLQAQLFPQVLPPLGDGWRWAVVNRPARLVGGDYHDAWPLASGRWAVAVGDVSGKGVPAALVLSGMRAYLRAEAHHAEDPAAMLARLNNWLHSDTQGQMFMTIILATVDLETGELVYANSGHPPALRMNAQGGVDELKGHSLMLGIQPDQEFEQWSARLEPGDKVMFHSDGATDIFNSQGERLGEKSLWELVEMAQSESPDRICQRLWETALSFAGGREQADDFTVLVLERMPESGSWES